MHHPHAVRQVQRGADLLQQKQRLFYVQRALPLQPLAQAAAAQIAHHQIGPLRIAPVIVERHNMRMFQARRQLRFHLETADKSRLAGKLRQDDLDRRLTLNRRLVSAIHRPKPTLSDLLAQFIAAQHLSDEVIHGC